MITMFQSLYLPFSAFLLVVHGSLQPQPYQLNKEGMQIFTKDVYCIAVLKSPECRCVVQIDRSQHISDIDIECSKSVTSIPYLEAINDVYNNVSRLLLQCHFSDSIQLNGI